jgi:cytosine/creatinine deaminase
MELRIVEARLPGREDLWEIAIADGLISQIDRTVTGTNILNAQGQLVIPGLVDAHMHLDKVYLLDRSQRREGTFGEAMRETLKAKQAFTIADIQTRARRGATAM